MIPQTLLTRLENSRNGDRPEALRGLGDWLATLDTAGLAAVRPDLLRLDGLRAADLDGLRADGLRRLDEQRRAQAALDAAEAGDVDSDASYAVQMGAAGTPFLVWHKRTPDGVTPVILAHFAPRVIGEMVRHRPGGETTRVLSVEIATPRGPRTMDVLPEDLADPRRFLTCCYNALGADLVLSSTAASRHLPLAATVLADPERPRSEVFEFTGWHERDGRLVYLSAGGAIGTDDPLTVDLSNMAAGTGCFPLANFGPRDDGDEALQAALAALSGPVRACLGDRVMLPQLAAVALAPALRWAPITELPVLHAMGVTGRGKTRSARILQAFYGLDRPALSWGWTQTAIEIVASSLRDCVVCIDDLKASTCDPRVAVKTMQRWADRRPRVRSNRSGSGLIGSPHIASLMLSNGEDLPAGEASVAARALFIPVETDAFNEDAFRAAEAALPVLSTLTARYIRWLAENQDGVGALIGESFNDARRRYLAHLVGRTRVNDAGRVASSCALLETGAMLLTRFLRTAPWPDDQAGEWMAATQDALEAIASAQAGMIDEESSAMLFLSAIAALLDQREVELVPVEAGKSCPPLAGCSADKPGARLIGYRRENEILLDPALALPAVRQWLQRQGLSRPVETNGLYAQLRSGGYLARVDKDKTAVVHKLSDRTQRRFLALKSTSIDQLADDEDQPEEAPRF